MGSVGGQHWLCPFCVLSQLNFFKSNLIPEVAFWQHRVQDQQQEGEREMEYAKQLCPVALL